MLRIQMNQNIDILLKKHEKICLEKHKDPTVFIEYLNNMQYVYKNIEEYNLGRKKKESVTLMMRLLI